jgi:hypothetical protein
VEIKCREGGIEIVGWTHYEYYYPYELVLSKPSMLKDEGWMKKIIEFHDSYFAGAEFDVPLAYIVFMKTTPLLKSSQYHYTQATLGRELI